MSSLLETIINDEPVTVAFDVTVELLRNAQLTDDALLLVASGLEFSKLRQLAIDRHPELTADEIDVALLRLVRETAWPKRQN